jgi:trigger factor
MSYVSQRYGYSVQYEVVNDKLGKAFSAAANEAQLRVAGTPNITQRDDGSEGQMAFDATFEVYPEVVLGDLSQVQVERVTAEVDDTAIDKTVEILRTQRRTFSQRPAVEGVQVGDRVTIDFEGKIDGEPFAGGKAEAYQFMVGEGQMLEQFDAAVRAMKVGESKTFPLQFPQDYQGQEVAGREADFLVTVRKVETPHLPQVDEAFAQSLGIADATVDGLRADVRKNLEREVKFRVLARNKANVMEALSQAAQLDLPKALTAQEVERLIEGARADLKQRGVKDAETSPIPPEIFTAQAERRVRLGLVVAELVRTHQLQARPEQLQAHIEELAQSYEKPAEVVRWYLSDRQRMSEVEGVVIESNVTAFVLSKTQVLERMLAFDELMKS